MRRRVICPELESEVEIEFDESPIDGTIIGVRSCTRFHANASHASVSVMCDTECIHKLNEDLDKLVQRAHEDLEPDDAKDVPDDVSDDVSDDRAHVHC